MDTQIIAVAAAMAGAVMTGGATLGLALLNGFRRLHNKIDQTARENREDNATQVQQLREDIATQVQQLREDNATQVQQLREAIANNAKAIAKNAEAIAKNAEAIAGIGGRIGVIENVLSAILAAVIPNRTQTHTVASIPTNVTASQIETERGTRAATTATASAAGS